jgi:hypothetical protein
VQAIAKLSVGWAGAKCPRVVGEIVGFLNAGLGQFDCVRASFLLVCATTCFLPAALAVAEKDLAGPHEFSGTLIKQVNGKKYQAQVFAKSDRLRLEYKYAIRTDYGYAGIEIIRLDLVEAWYLLAQQKELLVTPLDPDDVLPIEPTLPGEHSRTLVGEATAVGRGAQLYEVQTVRHGRMEQWYEWVDVEKRMVLKLVSRDRDWSFVYERIRWSPQPAQYFNEPLGYQRRHVPMVRGQRG